MAQTILQAAAIIGAVAAIGGALYKIYTAVAGIQAWTKAREEADTETSAKISALEEDTRTLKEGVKAQLRSEMIADFEKWSARGWAPVYARENFESRWQAYHGLGANGVMDDLRAKFLALPATEPEEGAEG